eukprot:scaffold43512_cov53-Phaeocystis_antarctica.AAC.1
MERRVFQWQQHEQRRGRASAISIGRRGGALSVVLAARFSIYLSICRARKITHVCFKSKQTGRQAGRQIASMVARYCCSAHRDIRALPCVVHR